MMTVLVGITKQLSELFGHKIKKHHNLVCTYMYLFFLQNYNHHFRLNIMPIR